MANLLRLIQKMKPQIDEAKKSSKKKKKKKVEKDEKTEEGKTDVELNKRLFPCLAIPNDPNARKLLEVKKDEDKKVADDMMGELEALFKTKDEPRKR